MNLLSKVKHEAKQIGLVTLYFLFCFGTAVALKKLILAAYQIEFYALSVAVIAALVVAKVVIVLDATHTATRFDARHPVWIAALYKTLIYSLATSVVLAVEKVFHAYRETGSLGPAVLEAWTHRDHNVMLAKVIVIGLAFAVYHVYVGIDRKLGKGTLWRLLVSRA